MYEKLSQQIQENIRKEVEDALSQPISEMNFSIKGIINSVDKLHQLLQPVIPRPGERVTDGEKPFPQGFVPVLPKDPYEVLLYFGFPADTPENVSNFYFNQVLLLII